MNTTALGRTTALGLIAAGVVAQAVGSATVANGDPSVFSSPTGNIVCMVVTDGVLCEIGQKYWEPPPPPPGCHAAWGNLFELKTGRPAGFHCTGSALPASNYTLEYGQTLSFGAISCRSERWGMSCTDATTGHFFFISRESYNLG